jgi:TolB-like protein/tetratricopeptide (TPR) repeat protein
VHDSRVGQLIDLFERALEVPQPQRTEFLERLCAGDPSLGAEVSALLAANESATGYFNALAERLLSPDVSRVGGPSPANGDAGAALRRQLEAALGDAYRLLDELGGGMSRVFLAEETKLGRKVVIKVLPPELAEGAGAERFRREIQLVAQLQHPHIVPLLTSGSAGSLLYYTMPFVPGESLRARLTRDGPLPVGDARAIWRDVIEALAHAHASGVVHRDVKPGNILLARRSAFVSDFGIARAMEAAAGDARDTAPGLAIGTPAYMAPEQVTGDRDADHRVDVYAAGLVMYEMLEGRLPFACDSARELILSRLTRDPSPITRPDCPPELAGLVGRCLAKSPAARPATAEALLTQLEKIPTTSTTRKAVTPVGRAPRRRERRVILYGAAAVALAASLVAVRPLIHHGLGAVGGATTSEESIAVMPLTNYSTDPSDSALADGMTKELIATLARVRNLRVVGRRSVFALRDQRLDPRQMAESLRVTSFIQGGFQKIGQRVRMQVRLVEARDNAIRWSETYDRDMVDIFAMQDSISRAVTRKLGIEGAGSSSTRRYFPRIESYVWYLRALAHTDASESDRRQVTDYLDRAIAADSNFAPAYVRLTDAYLFDRGDVAGRERELNARAEQAALKAVALDDSLAEAHRALGDAFMENSPRPEMPALRDWAGAEAEYKKALALNPRATNLYDSLSLLYMWTGRLAESLTAARAELEIDPFNYGAVRRLALALAMNGHCDEAITRLRPLQTMSAPGNIAGVITGECYAAKRMWPEAIAEFRWAKESGARTALPFLGYALARAGHRDEAMNVLSDLLTGRTYGHGAFGIASVYAGLGNYDEAFAWLDKAVDEGSMRPPIMGPMFDDLRRDPRFARVKKRLGLIGNRE